MEKTIKYLLIFIMLVGSICISSKDAKAMSCNASTVCEESCEYGGKTYDTVLIGDQCWFKNNLDVGTMIGNLETPDDTASTPNNPSTVQKWCFNDSLSNCTSEGGLYSWAEANGLANLCNNISCNTPTVNQGICPAGWHIPSDTEFYTLENYLTTTGETCNATRAGWDCLGAGTKLALGGSSGFDAIGAGNHETNGDLSLFDKREPSIHFWSSSPCLICSNYGHSYNRSLFYLSTPSDMVSRGWSNNAHGFSIRCLADTTITKPINKDLCKKNGWKTFNNPSFKNQGSCVSYLESNKNHK